MASATSPTLRRLGAALRTFLILTVLLGALYPLTMTGIAKVLFPHHAGGSLVETTEGRVGSELIGQAFTRPVTEAGETVTNQDGTPVMAPHPAYFQSRPSAAGSGYDPLASSASNYGPENPDLVALVVERRLASAELEGVDPASVAPGALLASGSGLDPHISPAYADLQVPRVARTRGLDPEQVRNLVQQNTRGRALGFLGEPHVNVLLLNLALDGLTGPPDAADSE
jgi:potassium-transporting ATPase KdpC subunit